MRHLLIIITVFAFLAVCEVNAQNKSLANDQNFSVKLSKDTNTSNLWIEYEITGSFGGYYSFVRTKPDMWDYEIPTSYDGQSAKTLKLIVYSPSYYVKTFNFPFLEKQNKNLEINLEPLKEITFSGKILLPDQLDADKLKLEISYLGDWKCEYFGLIDCLIGANKITTANLEKDGRFKVNLPDFASDKIISSFGSPGEFSFRLQDKQSGKFLFALKPKEQSKGFGGTQPALSYPTEQIFVPEPQK